MVIQQNDKSVGTYRMACRIHYKHEIFMCAFNLLILIPFDPFLRRGSDSGLGISEGREIIQNMFCWCNRGWRFTLESIMSHQYVLQVSVTDYRRNWNPCC